MRYKLFTKSNQAWRSMLEAIQNAKHHIYWESYILLDDTPEHDFFEALVKKAKEGVSVKVIVDGFGSLWLTSKSREELERAGGEVISFNPRHIYPRTHRKILIVDEVVAFVGGVNVAKGFEQWLDLQVRCTGKGIIRHMTRSFVKAYEQAGGKDAKVLVYREKKGMIRKRTGPQVWFLDHWPAKGKSLLKAYYKERIRTAEKSIVIVTPYFLPHVWLRKTLLRAVTRGVKVEVLLPRHTDGWFVNLANYIFSWLNEPKKIKFFFVNEMIHAKALFIDDHEGLIGSNNIDAQSFDYNVESGIVFQRKDIVGDFRKILDSWKDSAEEFNAEKDISWYHRLLIPLFRLLQPIL